MKKTIVEFTKGMRIPTEKNVGDFVAEQVERFHDVVFEIDGITVDATGGEFLRFTDNREVADARYKNDWFMTDIPRISITTIKKERKHEERSIERECIAYARRRGWDCWKNENNGNKGIPDYSLLSPSGRFVMVEFKRSATAHIRPEQKTWAEKHPDIVFFCHSLEDFTKIVDCTENDK